MQRRSLQLESYQANGEQATYKFSGKMNWMKLWIYEILILETQNEEINAKKIVAVKDATYMQLQ